MVPIVSIIGKSDSGKTTLIEKLIPELNQRGYHVGTIKHDAHTFDIDREGKDTWRHAKAGARTVVISSPAKLAVIKEVDVEHDLDALSKYMDGEVDIILTEGYKRGDKEKIEVFRSEVHKELMSTAEDKLVAVASDVEMDPGLPCYHIDDVKGIADFIEKRYLEPGHENNCSLYVNDKAIPLKPFVQDFIRGTIRGMLSALDNIPDSGDIFIRIADLQKDASSGKKDA
jgi:molybdopterin-guanine dinucleotide biosynthesis protein B